MFNRNFEMYLNVVKELYNPSTPNKNPNHNIHRLNKHLIGLQSCFLLLCKQLGYLCDIIDYFPPCIQLYLIDMMVDNIFIMGILQFFNLLQNKSEVLKHVISFGVLLVFLSCDDEVKIEELSLGLLVNILDEGINSYQLLPKLSVRLLEFLSNELFLALLAVFLEPAFSYLMTLGKLD